MEGELKTRKQLCFEMKVSWDTMSRRIKEANLTIPPYKLLSTIHQLAIKKAVLGDVVETN